MDSDDRRTTNGTRLHVRPSETQIRLRSRSLIRVFDGRFTDSQESNVSSGG